jgi:hypothetical protein
VDARAAADARARALGALKPADTMAFRGAVAEWLGRGLQSLVQRFESARRLSSRSDRVPSSSRLTGERRLAPGALLIANGFEASRGKEASKTLFRRIRMPEKPTLFVCHGDDGGPRFHPCRRVQEALRAAGIEYQKVIAGHGSPIPFLRRGSRDQLFEATGTKKLPTLKLPDGTIISHSRAILAWVREQSEQGDALKRAA